MSLIQKLLLSCAVMVQMSITFSKPAGCRGSDYEIMQTLLHYLETVEEEYVKDVFAGAAPNITANVTGITLPVKNITKEVCASACAIRVYLEQHIQPIIEDFIPEPDRLMDKVKRFNNQFIEALSVMKERCPHLSYVAPEGDYGKRLMGYKILHTVCEWMKEVISI